MASERAMVFGFCGSMSLLPVFTAVEIGEQIIHQPGFLAKQEYVLPPIMVTPGND